MPYTPKRFLSNEDMAIIAQAEVVYEAALIAGGYSPSVVRFRVNHAHDFGLFLAGKFDPATEKSKVRRFQSLTNVARRLIP